jgi:hypothetical protein
MKYSLRSLMILVAIVPPLLAMGWWLWLLYFDFTYSGTHVDPKWGKTLTETKLP